MYPYPGQNNPPNIGFPQQVPPNPGYPTSSGPGYPTNPAPYPNSAPYPSYPSPGQQPYPTAYPSNLPGQFPPQPFPGAQQNYSGYSPYPSAAPPFQGTGIYPNQFQSSQPLYPPSPQQPQQVSSYPPTQQEYPIAKAHIATTNQAPSSVQTMQVYQETPTIREAYFVATDDAKVLRTAMKGLGTDEAAIINVVCKRTNNQRQQIIQAYKTSYGKDLIKDIKSEISGKFEDAIVALMTPRYDYIAKRLHDAVSGIGTKEHVLIDILCSATNQEIQWLNAAYYRLYGKPMENDISSDTSGCFKRLMVSMCAAGRNENPVIDAALVAQDARDLLNAGIKKFGTDESEFNRLLATRSYPHLRSVFQEYEKISGQDIERTIKNEFSGDIEDGLNAIVKCVRNRAAYFAERLKKAMKGAGTNDSLLIFILVTRAEIDLENIKNEYFKMFNKPLVNDIQSETSGDYKKTLVTLCA